jgi:hypothetical protein
LKQSPAAVLSPWYPGNPIARESEGQGRAFFL